MASLQQQIEKAAALVQRAKNIVAMTGAGISTISGIPDFRSPDSSIWDEVDPLMVASIHAFRQDPTRFYRWVHPISHVFLNVEPNPAHEALVQLERDGNLKAVVTQNVDSLHSKAGSQIVYELHGHLRQATCTQCLRVQDATGLLEKFVASGEIPRCPHCGGVLKPNAILFGEQMPMQELVAAQVAIKAADLMLVVGSSLEVAPASDLPLTGLSHGAQLIIINYQPTYLDDRADVAIYADVSTVLPKIVELALAADTF